MKGYYWCSEELEPHYLNCYKCPYGKTFSEDCPCRHILHPDAVRDCDLKRISKSLPTIANDFDFLKKNYREREIVENTQPEKKLSEQMKEEAMAKTTAGNAKLYSGGDNMDITTILGGVAVCALLGFPSAYIGQIFQLLSMFLYDTFRVFTATGPMPEIWSESFRDSFFHAEFWNRYWYWTTLMIALFSWSSYNTNGENNETETTFRICASVAFVLVALMNFNLFISSIVGPVFLVFGLFVTARRR